MKSIPPIGSRFECANETWLSVPMLNKLGAWKAQGPNRHFDWWTDDGLAIVELFVIYPAEANWQSLASASGWTGDDAAELALARFAGGVAVMTAHNCAVHGQNMPDACICQGARYWMDRALLAEQHLRSAERDIQSIGTKLDAAERKASQFERDWIDAKSEFGTAMAKARERTEHEFNRANALEKQVLRREQQLSEDAHCASVVATEMYPARGLSRAQKRVLVNLLPFEESGMPVRWPTAAVLVPAGLIRCVDQRHGLFVLTEQGRTVAIAIDPGTRHQ